MIDTRTIKFINKVQESLSASVVIEFTAARKWLASIRPHFGHQLLIVEPNETTVTLPIGSGRMPEDAVDDLSARLITTGKRCIANTVTGDRWQYQDDQFVKL